eukprot:TRINITY_DN7579_c0_g1_i2.p1 TRINITY_DN7579_c0_g1~~TRINITY_DN7579_c0_g1_i2.p1  ORF type:complete len:162 (-),score=7.13 TRINITY_DN7579_c0_g1_i2:158-643(-)
MFHPMSQTEQHDYAVNGDLGLFRNQPPEVGTRAPDSFAGGGWEHAMQRRIGSAPANYHAHTELYSQPTLLHACRVDTEMNRHMYAPDPRGGMKGLDTRMAPRTHTRLPSANLPGGWGEAHERSVASAMRDQMFGGAPPREHAGKWLGATLSAARYPLGPSY